MWCCCAPAKKTACCLPAGPRTNRHAGRYRPTPKGSTLQVHQRDPQWSPRTPIPRIPGAEVHHVVERHRGPAAGLLNWRSPPNHNHQSETDPGPRSHCPEVPLRAVLAPATAVPERGGRQAKRCAATMPIISALGEGTRAKRALQWRLGRRIVPQTPKLGPKSPERAKKENSVQDRSEAANGKGNLSDAADRHLRHSVILYGLC